MKGNKKRNPISPLQSLLPSHSADSFFCPFSEINVINIFNDCPKINISGKPFIEEHALVYVTEAIEDIWGMSLPVLQRQ